MNAVAWWDGVAMDAVFRLHRPWLDPLVIGVTQLGDWQFLLVVVLAVVAFLLIRRRPRTALILAAAALAAFPLSEGVKVLVGRPRPEVPWRLIALPSSYSFPSGHSLESMTVYGALALTLGRRLRGRRFRVMALALCVALPLLIGFSRVYLGVHYPTDVLAGWAAGLALALLAGWANRRWGGPLSPDPGRAAPA